MTRREIVVRRAADAVRFRRPEPSPRRGRVVALPAAAVAARRRPPRSPRPRAPPLVADARNAGRRRTPENGGQTEHPHANGDESETARNGDETNENAARLDPRASASPGRPTRLSATVVRLRSSSTPATRSRLSSADAYHGSLSAAACATVSRTVRNGERWSSDCGTNATVSRRVSGATRAPSSVARPDATRTPVDASARPETARSRVLFPAPEGPSTATVSPRENDPETSRRSVRGARRKRTFCFFAAKNENVAPRRETRSRRRPGLGGGGGGGGGASAARATTAVRDPSEDPLAGEPDAPGRSSSRRVESVIATRTHRAVVSHVIPSNASVATEEAAGEASRLPPVAAADGLGDGTPSPPRRRTKPPPRRRPNAPRSSKRNRAGRDRPRRRSRVRPRRRRAPVRVRPGLLPRAFATQLCAFPPARVAAPRRTRVRVSLRSRRCTLVLRCTARRRPSFR